MSLPHGLNWAMQSRFAGAGLLKAVLEVSGVMRKVMSIVMGCLALSTIVAADEEPFADAIQTVFDERFVEFVAADSRVEILAPDAGQDIGWAEGPLWVADLDSLLFSDVANDTIYRWNEATGVTTYLRPSGHPADDAGHAWRGSNGLGVDGDGNLILAQQSNRTLSRMRATLQNPAPDYEVLVERYRGQKLNSPNDLVVNAAGDIYFTDPPYGLSGFENSPDIELGFFGVFRLTRQGDLSTVSKALEKPNGLALSADQRTLYVSNSDDDAPQIVAIDLDAEGNSIGSRLFFDARSLVTDGAGSTDGMAMYPGDMLFTSIPNGVGILSPQGELLGKIALGQVTNLAFDASFNYLYITTPNRLLRLRIKAGPGFPAATHSVPEDE